MKKRHSAEQIVAELRQADVALGRALKVPEVCRELGISEQTYYRSSSRRRLGAGWIGLRWAHCMLRKPVLGRMDTWRASTASYGMSC